MAEKGLDSHERFIYTDNTLAALGYHEPLRACTADVFAFEFAWPPGTPAATLLMFGDTGATLTLDFRVHACAATEAHNNHEITWQDSGLALDTNGALTLFSHDITANLTSGGVTAGDIPGLEAEVSGLTGVSWFRVVGLKIANANFHVLYTPRR